jgi:AAA+ superfamily predicted ATPase
MDIAKQMNWLESWIKARLTLNANLKFEEIYQNCPLSEEIEKDRQLESELHGNVELTLEEKLVVSLAYSPLIIPDFLNKLIRTRVTKDNNQNIFPGYINRSETSFLPTFETALFLLAGLNVNERRKFLKVFSAKSALFHQSLIKTPESRFDLPFTESLLSPGPTLMNALFIENQDSPDFSYDFPAALLTSDFGWDELIVNEDTKISLEEIKEYLNYEDIVKKNNLLIKKFKAGYKCLFHGPPGTGKTLAASLIGKLTGRNVYRIDLSAVVSKYIGETEKNLARIFERADHGNWILFFDEADALFGKRGQTQNARDRYANQEVSYLLQRFETYSGVAILATNYKENMDRAFLRRLHSIINFKPPEPDERLTLWQTYLPEGFTFAEDINLSDIAKSVKINGSGIYNVMRRSVMKSVLRSDSKILGNDLLEAVKIELSKENKFI